MISNDALFLTRRIHGEVVTATATRWGYLMPQVAATTATYFCRVVDGPP